MAKIKYSELKVGMKLKANDYVNCIEPKECEVLQAKDGSFYVKCDQGKHYLDAQKDFNDNDTLINFEAVE